MPSSLRANCITDTEASGDASLRRGAGPRRHLGLPPYDGGIPYGASGFFPGAADAGVTGDNLLIVCFGDYDCLCFIPAAVSATDFAGH